MPHNRYFLNSPLKNGSEEILNVAESHHLLHVLRCKEGEKIEIVNGDGCLAEAEFFSSHKGLAHIRILTSSHCPPPLAKLILVQAIPRFNRLEFILEKGTELGMDAIWLFLGERSEKALVPHQKGRIEALLIAALKQSGRLFLPELLFLPPLQKWESPVGQLLFGDLEEAAPPLIKACRPASQQTLFFVGPEAGLTPRESAKIREWGGLGVRLHQNTLRTDTAPLVALTLLSSLIRPLA